MPAPHHSVFLQAGCPSCRPTNSVKALKGVVCGFTYADIHLRHSELVQQLRDHVQDTLLDHLINLGTGPTLANRRICDLLLLMPLLTHKRILAKEFWLGVKQGGRVTLHKLLSEMLEFLSG